MNNEFPSNSKQPRRPVEEKKLESVVVNKVVAGKPPLGRRLRDMFFAGDSRSAAQSVVSDVIIPQIKDMVAEAAREALERLIFGDSRGGRRTNYSRYSASSNSSYTNYNRYSGRSQSSSRYTREERNPNARLRRDDIEYIVLETRAEAQEVLDNLEAVLEKYEKVSIADLKSLIDWSADLTDQNWGWESLAGARVARDSQGYALILPKPDALD
jgi:hypothetical protein